jgi:diguanylate cyclase (GGDEF)-like protein
MSDLPLPANHLPRSEPHQSFGASISTTLIARLKAELDAKETALLEQANALAHNRKIFERSSAAARIGLWECGLPDETLRWTDVVYEMFDLPKDAVLDRKQIVGCYSEASAKELQARRARAIETHTGFTLDAEIVTAKGTRRWLRLTATVECEHDVPVRIFGMKQDITEEKIAQDRIRYLADFDPMTGLANRSQFQSKLSELCLAQPALGAMLLIDLDGFKKVNDTLGHAMGDECLKTAATRLLVACGQAELVARVGGDEFAVLLGSHIDREQVETLARDIVETLRIPVVHNGEALMLGASVGVAFPDETEASELFRMADTALYASKAAGRNTFRIFDPFQDSGSKSASFSSQL